MNCKTCKFSPIDKVYKPIPYKVDPMLTAEGGLVDDIYQTATKGLNEGGFYDAAGGDTACALAHPFNKTARKQCEADAAARMMVKNAGKQSDANLNDAIAQGIANKGNQKSDDGGSTKKILIYSGIGLVVVTGIFLIIRKMKKSQ